MATRKNWISTEKKLQKQKKNNVCSKRADRLVGSFFVQKQKNLSVGFVSKCLTRKSNPDSFFQKWETGGNDIRFITKKQKSFKALL